MSPVHVMGALAYRAAVQLYPPGFRREFGHEMARDFSQATREASDEGTRASVARLWARVGMDFICTLVLQWARTGTPFVILIAVGCSTVGIGLAANVIAGRTWVETPPPTMDPDMVALFVLVVGLLLVIVATITVTLWITRSLLRRSRS